MSSNLEKTIKIVDPKGKVLAELSKIMKDVTVDEFKKMLVSFNPFPYKGMSTSRVRLTMADQAKTALTEKRKTLNDYSTNEVMTLVFKDLGPQISWKTVFLFEYAGPLVICGILTAFRKQIYQTKKPLTLNQKIGLALVFAHYLKREFETLFVHRFSNDTMPIFNLLKNSFHYWVIFGFINMYFFLHPDYRPPSWARSKKFMYGVVILFVLFEYFNLMTHITLRNLRKPGTRERGIPNGWGFQWISCANYWWEFLCWLLFCIQSGHPGSFIFLAVSVVQMIIWAIDKQNRYLKDFKNYPKSRYIMFPFVF